MLYSHASFTLLAYAHVVRGLGKMTKDFMMEISIRKKMETLKD